MDEETPKLSWDHQIFLVEGKPFYPQLGDNIVIAPLPCEPHEPLNWIIPETTKQIVWEFELGLHHPFFPLDDELRFQALAAALKYFSDAVWPKYKDQTLGGILYRGGVNWSEERGDALAAYFQLLAHRLPDELPLVLCFDVRSIPSRAKALSIVSKERFEYFLLALQADKWPAPSLVWGANQFAFHSIPCQVGLCLPQKSYLCEELLVQIDEAMGELDVEGILFRVVPEAFLTEQWDGLDELVVFSEYVSAQGRRKLLGFEAAGGVIREKVRGRGI